MAWTVDSLSFNTRKTVTADYTLVPSDQSDYAVPFIRAADADIGADGTASGGDVRFTLVVGGTLLTYERELWSVAGGQATAVWHVKIPLLSSTANTQVYCYYNTSTGSPPDGDDGGAGNTWDTNYKGVWHLPETGTGAAGDYKDSTANNNDSTNTTAQPTQTSAGKADGAQDFDGTNDRIDFAADAAIPGTGNATLEAWVKADTVGVVGGVFGRTRAAGLAGRFVLLIESPNWEAIVQSNLDTQTLVGSAVSTGVWKHLTLVRNGTGLIFYENGVSVATGTLTAGATITNTDPWRIGTYPDSDGNPANWFDGIIDEVRISNVARTANYILTSYRAQANLLLSWGAEEVGTVNVTKPMGSYFFRGAKNWIN